MKREYQWKCIRSVYESTHIRRWGILDCVPVAVELRDSSRGIVLAPIVGTKAPGRHIRKVSMMSHLKKDQRTYFASLFFNGCMILPLRTPPVFATPLP